jgi:hypothetical protein
MGEREQPPSSIEYTLPYTIKADIAGYIVFGVIFGGLALFCGVTVLKTPGGWDSVLIPLVFMLGFWIWLSSYCVVLFEDRLTRRTIFSKKEVMFSEVSKAVWLRMTGPPLRMRFYLANGKATVVVNTKLMNRRDLAVFMDLVAKKVSKIRSRGVSNVRDLSRSV